MTQSVQILGPNLPRIPETVRHGETFHVHAQGCADLKRYGRRFDGWTADAESCEEIAHDIYSDMIDHNGGEMTIADAMGDVWSAPCVTLPTDTDTHSHSNPED